MSSSEEMCGGFLLFWIIVSFVLPFLYKKLKRWLWGEMVEAKQQLDFEMAVASHHDRFR